MKANVGMGSKFEGANFSISTTKWDDIKLHEIRLIKMDLKTFWWGLFSTSHLYLHRIKSKNSLVSAIE